MRTWRARALPLAALALAVALCATPSGALAAKGAAPAATPPVASGPVGVQFGPAEQSGASSIIVGVAIDPSVKLPVRVRIPVPKGYSIGWAGEILGGAASADPQRSYALNPGAGGGQYAEFTISVSHDAQIDTYGPPPVDNNGRIQAMATFIQSVPATSTTVSIQLPANISNVSLSPSQLAPPQTNSAGESLYAVLDRPVATGEALQLAASYQVGAAKPVGASSNSTPLIILLVVALVAVVIALALVLRGSGGGSGEMSDADAQSEDAEEGDAGEGASHEPEVAEDEAPSYTDDSNDPFDSIDME